MNIWKDLLERVTRIERKMWGSYRGEVTNVDDPEGLGRIKIKLSGLFGEQFETNWAMPKAALVGDDAGFWMIPDVGDFVWVEFQFGDRNSPAWKGGFWTTQKKPPKEANKNIRMIKSKSGHLFAMDDDKKEFTIKSVGDMKLIVAGNLEANIEGDAKITAKGNVEVNGTLVKLVRGQSPVICADTLCPVTGAPHVPAQTKVVA